MKNIKYNTLLTLVIFFTSISAIAQDKKNSLNEIDLRNQIQLSLISYYNTHGSEYFGEKKYQNNAYTFGFTITVNQNGVVDKISFSNKSALLDSIVSFNSITDFLKSKRAAKAFSIHKNTVFVGVALVRKGWEYSIENLDTFDTYFYNLIPDLEEISPQMKIRFLPAFSMVQGKKKY